MIHSNGVGPRLTKSEIKRAQRAGGVHSDNSWIDE